MCILQQNTGRHIATRNVPFYYNTNKHCGNHCVGKLSSNHSQPLYRLIGLKLLLKKNGSPSTTQTNTVWSNTTTVSVNWPQIITGKQLSGPVTNFQGPMCIRGSPSTTQISTGWTHINHCVVYLKLKH